MTVGAIASVITGFYLLITDTEIWASDRTATDVVFFMVFNTGIGLIYSVFAQMGFFAYLTVNYIAKSVFKRRIIWATVQWILIAIVFFDVIYLRYVYFDYSGDRLQALFSYSILPVIVFVIAIVTAVLKSKMTNATAFTPTMFFIFAVTLLEVVPALRHNVASTTILAVVPVLCCNIWQILKLHTILQSERGASKSAEAQGA